MHSGDIFFLLYSFISLFLAFPLRRAVSGALWSSVVLFSLENQLTSVQSDLIAANARLHYCARVCETNEFFSTRIKIG